MGFNSGFKGLSRNFWVLNSSSHAKPNMRVGAVVVAQT